LGKRNIKFTPYFLNGTLITEDVRKMDERSAKKFKQLGLLVKGNSGKFGLECGCTFRAL